MKKMHLPYLSVTSGGSTVELTAAELFGLRVVAAETNGTPALMPRVIRALKRKGLAIGVFHLQLSPFGRVVLHIAEFTIEQPTFKPLHAVK